MNNIPILAKDLKKEIEKFLTTECGGEDVNEEEERMYEYLRYAVGYIDKFLKTQQMTNRKFEVGKAYYDKNYELKVVEKFTPNGLWFKSAYGASRVKKCTDGNEIVDGVYEVKA